MVRKPGEGHVTLRVSLNLQSAYDEARNLEAMWKAAAENLEADTVICDHPQSLRIPADDVVPAFCKGCDQAVPAWALRRDGEI